jgi:Fe-S cluster assembly protein SufD
MTATTTGTEASAAGEDAGNPTTSAAGPVLQGSHSHGLGSKIPDQSRAERLASFDPDEFGVPTGREEVWRFTPMNRLNGLHTGAEGSGDRPDVEVDAATGVRVELVDRDDVRLGRVGKPEDRVAAQAWTSFRQAMVVTLPAELAADRPTTVSVLGQGGLSYAHVTVLAEQYSSGVVVLDHRGSGTLAANVELDLADGAQLTLVSIQDWDDDAVHLSSQRARLGRDARLKHVVVTLGGDVVRITPTAAFTGPGAEVEMLGLYFADAGQHQEHQLFVDHAVPRCKSRVTYKGALQGEGAHTVWVGDVLIRAAAESTDTYELNRNLVLTDGARADSVPNLEIETGEIVGAGHASATGRFDDEQLFYLQSRGIGEDEARRMVVRGFFAELLQRIGVEPIAQRLMTAIDAELAAVTGGSGVAGPVEVAGVTAMPGGPA